MKGVKGDTAVAIALLLGWLFAVLLVVTGAA